MGRNGVGGMGYNFPWKKSKGMLLPHYNLGMGQDPSMGLPHLPTEKKENVRETQEQPQ